MPSYHASSPSQASRYEVIPRTASDLRAMLVCERDRMTERIDSLDHNCATLTDRPDPHHGLRRSTDDNAGLKTVRHR